MKTNSAEKLSKSPSYIATQFGSRVSGSGSRVSGFMQGPIRLE